MRTRRHRRLASCAHRLGFDRNPLRRRTDRIEAAMRLILLMLLVVVVPVAAIAVGRQADHVALRQADAQRAADHLVTAVLLEQAPATGISDPYSSVQTAWVPARWQLPGKPGQTRTGNVLAPVGARKGSTVQTWVNASGAVTNPPPDHRAIVGDVFIAVIVTCFASLLMLLVLGAVTHRALDRRRMNAWETEWRATGPRWSGHRS